jgi:hypothetical protein
MLPEPAIDRRDAVHLREAPVIIHARASDFPRAPQGIWRGLTGDCAVI